MNEVEESESTTPPEDSAVVFTRKLLDLADFCWDNYPCEKRLAALLQDPHTTRARLALLQTKLTKVFDTLKI